MVIEMANLRKRAFFKLVIWEILSISLFFVFLSHLALFTVPNLKIEDFFTFLNYKIHPLPAQINQITLITVDDESYRILNKRMPWERKIFADFLDKIQPFNPKVVAFDFSFLGDSPYPEDDVAFAQSLAKNGKVILGAYFDPDGKYVLPLPLLMENALSAGLVNKPRDPDFFVRRTKGFVISRSTGKPIDYSLEIKTLAQYLGVSPENISYNGQGIVLKKTDGNTILIPIPKDGIVHSNFRAYITDFKPISFWRVIKGQISSENFKDKIVLVGSTGEVFHDIYHSPFGLMPGVVINANNLLMFLNRDYVKYMDRAAEFWMLIFMGLAVVLAAYLFTPLVTFLLSLLGLVSFLAISFILFVNNYRFDYFNGVFVIVATYTGISLYRYIKLWVENERLRTLAITDEVTGLFIHRYFLLRLQNEFERTLRYNIPLSLAMIDIDHFKAINDTYGHEQGNKILKYLGQILSAQSRKADIVARYGGEEFCIIMVHTNPEGALFYGERIRKVVERFEFPYKSGKTLKVTISMGIATFPEFKTKKVEELIEAADKALYKAKESGRNQVCAYQESSSSKKP